jgi:hypothetical protein
MKSREGLNGLLYINTEGRSTSSCYVTRCWLFQVQHQQTCHEQRGQLRKTPGSLFEQSSFDHNG